MSYRIWSGKDIPAFETLPWSSGEVTVATTIASRTGKPEFGGLYCPRIFGSMRPDSCHCGEVRGATALGSTCGRCGVTVCDAEQRLDRVGHIALPVPVVNPVFLMRSPKPIASLLGVTSKEAKLVARREAYLVIEPGQSGMAAAQVLSDEQLQQRRLDPKTDDVTVMQGAEAIRAALTTGPRAASIAETCRQRGWCLATMVIDVLPVAPIAVRALQTPEGRLLRLNDLTELYRIVLSRSQRLRRLQEVNAPPVIIRNESCMLQRAVEQVFENSICPVPAFEPIAIPGGPQTGERMCWSIRDM